MKMNSNHSFHIAVGGIEVEGIVIHRTDADLIIQIVDPYTDLSSGCHIPYFSRPINSFLTDYGISMAENLLKYLYELGEYMVKNNKFIKLQFALHFRDGDLSDHECQNRFFNSTFPFVVPIDTRDDVLRKIQ